MHLSKLRIENMRLFKKPVTINLHKGLNLLVGENGCGKSTVIDAIRMLLNESEFSHKGITAEDFNSSGCAENTSHCRLFIIGVFSELTDEQKVEYLTWLNHNFDARLNVEYLHSINVRGNYKQKRWGGCSSNSAFDWEPLNDIQCVYLPALRDAERYLRAGRGSRLSRLLTNLSADELKEKRKNKEKMELETEVAAFNHTIEQKTDIERANKLINDSLKESAGSVFAQSTSIRFNELSYERIVESLQLLFSNELDVKEDTAFFSLCENSLGYNNLIYIATILAEFEGLKEKYSSPRILLVEELEAHLHPQLQIKLLKYLSKQAAEHDIQVIITTHSAILAAATPINQIICFNRCKDGISITPISKCELENDSENFINRWLDATKSMLLFSKGNIFVEGIAEAILVPKLAEIYLKSKGSLGVTSLEDAGVSVINLNGIYFQHFIKMYSGYRISIPEQEEKETKTAYKERVDEFKKKNSFAEGEFRKVKYIKVKCAVITDNDPVDNQDKFINPDNGEEVVKKEPATPTKDNCLPSGNPQIYLKEQLENMTDNCRVYSNLKTFEYDLAIESHSNARIMLEIILDSITTNGDIADKAQKYIDEIDKEEREDEFSINDAEIALFILKQIDSSYLGKGLFAQLLCDKIDDSFIVPDYICKAIDFVLGLEENND